MSENELTITDITAEQWKLYREIQDGGETNMLDTATVELLSDFELDRATQYVIRKHYDELAGKFGN